MTNNLGRMYAIGIMNPLPQHPGRRSCSATNFQNIRSQYNGDSHRRFRGLGNCSDCPVLCRNLSGSLLETGADSDRCPDWFHLIFALCRRNSLDAVSHSSCDWRYCRCDCNASTLKLNSSTGSGPTRASMGAFDSVMDLSLFVAPLIAVLVYKSTGQIAPIFLIAVVPALLALFATTIWLKEHPKP